MRDEAGSTLRTHVETGLVYAHAVAALVTLFVAVTFGILISLQFVWPDAIGGTPPLSWGRLRYNHTQGIMLGWLGNAFLAFLYHAVPVLTGRRVASARLGWWMFGLWNFAVMLPGWVLVLAGISQPLEWAEFPLIVDAVVIVALGLAAAQFLPPFFRGGVEDLYVSSWYIVGALVFTLLAYPMGNLVPETVPGAAGAAFSGLWIHDAVGLFVTPLALAILYFVIPAVTRRPIYSHFLSMLGFWGLFLIYPLNGTHHYVFSVIPMAAQMGAIAASTILGVDVIIVVFNLLMSSRGSGLFPRDPGLRFVVMSTVFYLVVSLQGSLQAQMSINQAVHFTDWVIGHSHLAMLGFATFAAIGGIVHAWQRITWARYNARAIDWSFWLLFFGVVVMVVDLTVAGLLEARLWGDQAPWLESVRAAQPYWLIRTLSAVPLTAGFAALFVGLTTGPRGAALSADGRASGQPDREIVSPRLIAPEDASVVLRSGRTLRKAYTVAGLAGVVFFAMSVALLGVWPKRVLAEEAELTAPVSLTALSDAELRGRRVYAREGCAYCHTQQIRYTEADIARFGAPTLAWETRLDHPHLMGTRRIGPDLSRAGSTRSADWQFAHLFRPRTVVPDSVMPAYPWLFDGAPDRPTGQARDLLAYLETLGRARELAWPEGEEKARTAAPDHRWVQMSVDAPLLNAHPGRTRPTGDVPAALSVSAEPSPGGRELWARHCASCHGDEGRGDGPAASWLRPRPTDLAEREYSLERLSDALWNGVAGTSMPAWRDLSRADHAELAAVVRGFARLEQEAEPAADVVALGQTVYAAHCAQCHGDEGSGNGFAAGEFPIAPTSFRWQRPALGAAVQAITDGVEGTSMAPWADRLTEEEILAVAHAVRTFYDDVRAGAEGRK
jgi:cytochrome c oxidase cbb3-type subunit I/II